MPARPSDAQLAKIAAELARRAQRASALDGAMLPAQRKFIQDPSQFKAAICPRRSGKSYAIGLYLVSTALQYPGCNLLFVGKTRQHAKDIIWKDILRPVLHMLGMSPSGWNKSELSFTFPNGSVLRVTGADTTDDVSEKFRGIKYKLAVFDECASWRLDLSDIVYNKVGPAMADALGTICLIGTPGNVKNFFYQVTTGKEPGWSVHRWTWEDNPHVAANVKEHIGKLLASNPLLAETPKFRQEWYAEWTVDETKLVYRYDEERNSADVLPPGREWMYVIGLDLGYNDDTAWVVVAYTLRGDKRLFVVDAVKEPKLIISTVAERTQQLIDQYNPVAVVVDYAAKQSVEELRQRFGLPLQDAEKRDKAAAIDMLNSDLITGVVKVLPPAKELVDEWEQLVWDEKMLAKTPPKRFEDPRCANHLSDAMLYAFRRTRNYAASADPPPQPGRDTDEWAQAFWDRDTERQAARQAQPWWERDNPDLEEEESW